MTEQRPCSFCKKPFHFGICDEMRKAQDEASKRGAPVPNPHVRQG